jgi:hypothetical protein
MLARLNRKAEERKKDKRARDKRPTEYLETVSYLWVILPNKARDLGNRRIVGVYFGPARPRFDTGLCAGHDEIRRQWNGPEYLSSGKGHQAEVQAATKTIGRRHYYLPELTLTLMERVNAHDCSQ